MEKARQFVLVSLTDARPYFTGETSPPYGRVFKLRTDVRNLIGRGPEATICIKDSRVARVQCEITWIDGQQVFQIVNTHCPVPSRINGVVLSPGQPVLLTPGDEIQIGVSVMQYRLKEDWIPC